MFQFLTITYNHEKYIIEHLESIKFQVENYNIDKPSLLVFDDCSTDRTIILIDLWINRNRALFDEVLIHVNQQNLGVVRNYLMLVNNISSQNYKILAGDDLYYRNRVENVCNRFDFVATPVISFSGTEHYEYDIKYSDRISTIPKVQNLLTQGNCFFAPGIIMRKSLIQDEGLIEHVSRFKWIEDLPSWQYLFRRGNVDFTYGTITSPIVMYRSNVGIYGNRHIISETKKKFLTEEREIFNYYQIIPNSTNSIFKYLRPYNYINKINQIIITMTKNKEKETIISEAKSYYLMIKNRADSFLAEMSQQGLFELKSVVDSRDKAK